jgi:phage terminase small subunit
VSTALNPANQQLPPPAKPHLIFGGLSKREYLFVDYYLADPEGNGTLAARKAGFTGTDESLWTTASRLLRRAKVQAEIRRRLGNHIASADEVLERLTTHARGDLTDVLKPDGSFDLRYAKRKGTSKLLKKLKVKKRIERSQDGKVTEHIDHEYEIHDPQAALVHLGKVHGLFIDKLEVEGHENPANSLASVLSVVREAIEAYRVSQAAQLAQSRIVASEQAAIETTAKVIESGD